MPFHGAFQDAVEQLSGREHGGAGSQSRSRTGADCDPRSDGFALSPPMQSAHHVAQFPLGTLQIEARNYSARVPSCIAYDGRDIEPAAGAKLLYAVRTPPPRRVLLPSVCVSKICWESCPRSTAR